MPTNIKKIERADPINDLFSQKLALIAIEPSFKRGYIKMSFI